FCGLGMLSKYSYAMLIGALFLASMTVAQVRRASTAPSVVAHSRIHRVGSCRPPGDLAVGGAEGVRLPNHAVRPRWKSGENDFGDHRATRALRAPERLPACAAGLPPCPRSRRPASLHAGFLAFGVPPRTERPPQAGRGMGMPRPALLRGLNARGGGGP
ncbi:MAG: hypothetical protein E2601_11380, partial [Microbacterium sp.]|nr:hypothetical protein [Microbacterium sp.]